MHPSNASQNLPLPPGPQRCQPCTWSDAYRTATGYAAVPLQTPGRAWRNCDEDREELALPTDPACRLLHDVPDGFGGQRPGQWLSHLAHAPENRAAIDSSGWQPVLQFLLDPIRNRNGMDVAGLAHHVNNGPVLFSPLQVVHPQANGFMPPPPTSQSDW